MACTPSTFAAAVDLIARAGSDGLSLTAALSAATANPAPRPALVAWLLRALRASNLPIVLTRGPSGDWVAAARLPLRLRALGHNSLEHPLLGDQPARALAVLGTSGRAGVLQTDLAKILGLNFSTAHHYLLSLLACDLVVRRRVQYERFVDGKPEVALDAGGITSNIVVSKFMLPGGCGVALPETASNATGDGPLRRLSEPIKPMMEVIFELCCKLVAFLRERPGASASQHDIKDQLLPLQTGRFRHRHFAAARQKLLRANIIIVEDSLCLDARGSNQGIQSCIRLAPEYLIPARRAMETRPSVADDRDTGADFDFDQLALDSIGPPTIDGGEAHADESKGASAYCPRENPVCELTPASLVLEKGLERHSSIMQASYEMLARRGSKGLSYVDMHFAFSRIIDKRLAKMAYRALKGGTSKIDEALEYYGRTRRHTLYLEVPVDARRLTLSEEKLAGMMPGSPPPENTAGSDGVGGAGLGESDPSVDPVATHSEEITASPVSLPNPRTHYEPTPLKGMSHLALQRVQIADGVLRRYRVVRLDKVGRVLGAIEGKDSFQVDRRVVDRVLECLFRDGRAKRFLLSASPAARADGSRHASLEADGGVAVESTTAHLVEGDEVPFVCLPDFETRAPDVQKRVDAAHARLLADLPQMKAPKKPDYVLRAATLQSAVKTASNDATFVSVACRNPELEKKPISGSLKLNRCLGRLLAVDYGWIRALIPRARRLHKLFYQHAKVPFASQRNAATGILGAVLENDVVGGMTLHDYAQIIGIFFTIEYPKPFADSGNVYLLPQHLRNELLSSTHGKSQRAVLTSLLSRLGLISRCSGSKSWLVHGGCALRDFGKGIPAAVARGSMSFDSEGGIDKFWSQLELYKSMHGNAANSVVNPLEQESGEESDDFALLDTSSQKEEGLSNLQVEEIYDPRHWSMEEPDPLSIDEQIEIENSLQNKIALLASTCKKKLQPDVAFNSLDQFSDEERLYLYSKVNRYLHSDLPYERVIAHIRFRFANPLSPEARHRIEEARDEYIPTSQGNTGRYRCGRGTNRRGKRRRTVTEPLAANAPLVAPGRRKRARLEKKSGLERDTKLLLLASELRAVVDSEVLLDISNAIGSTGWHLRGLYPDDEVSVESEMGRLWVDLAKAVDLDIGECKNRLKQLCDDIDVLLAFEETVVAWRKQELYPLDVGLTLSSRGDSEDEHKAVAFDASSVLREALERRFARETVKRKAASASKSAHDVHPRSKAIEEAPRSLGKQSTRFDMAVSDDVDDQPLVVPSKKDCNRVVSGCSRRDLGVVSTGFEDTCAFGVLCKYACMKTDVTADEISFDEDGDTNGLCGHARFALCAQTILIILTEPRQSFELRNAIYLLKQFPPRLLTYSRDALLSCALIRRRDFASACGRMFCASVVVEFASTQGREVQKGVETLHKLQQRLAVCAHEIESVPFFVPSISRHELLATLQCAFAHQRYEAIQSRLMLMPSACDLDNEVQQSGASESTIEFGVEGSALLRCTSTAEPVTPIDNSPPLARSNKHSLPMQNRLDIVLSLMKEHCKQSQMVESTCVEIMKVIEANSSGSGVSGRRLIEETSSLGCSPQTVTYGLAFMIEQGLVARVSIPRCPRNIKTGIEEIVYLPYVWACLRHHYPIGEGGPPDDDELDARHRPLTPWSRMDGGLDNELCHQMQARIISALKLAPGSDETKLIDFLKPLHFPEQALRDTLWALTRHDILSCVYRKDLAEPCSLLSSSGSIVPPSAVEPGVLHFVDGIETSDTPRKYARSYFLHGIFQARLLDVAEVVEACESSPGLRGL